MKRLMGTNRVIWIDNLRAILIACVVSGHVFGTVAHFVPSQDMWFYELGFKVVYSFHMPAFFMLSGLLVGNGVLHTPVDVLSKMMARRLLIPYLSFGVLSILVYQFAMPLFWNSSAAGGNLFYGAFTEVDWWHPWASLIYGAPFPGTDGFRCNSVLWFLPCLFSVRLIGILLLRLLCKCRIGVIAIIITLIALLGWIELRYVVVSLPFGLSVLFWYLPYFFIGHAIRPVVVNDRPSNLGVVLGMLVMFVVGIYYIPDIVYSREDLGWYIVAFALGVIGSFLSIFVAKQHVGSCHTIDCNMAKNTIGIMFIHKYCVLFFTMCIPLLVKLFAKSFLLHAFTAVLIIATSIILSCGASVFIRKHMAWMLGEGYEKPER